MRDMTRTFTLVFGVIYALVGIVGLIWPGGFSQQPYTFLGIFQLNLLHNLVHLIVGVLGIAASRSSYSTARQYCQVFGVVFALLTILGLFEPFPTLVPLGGI